LFGMFSVLGAYPVIVLASLRGLLTGVVLAPILAGLLKSAFGMQVIATLAVCVCSWLMLALAGYHREFLRDLPSSFDDDSHWIKADAVGALQVCLDLVNILLIVIQLRWLQEFLQEQNRSRIESGKRLRASIFTKN